VAIPGFTAHTAIGPAAGRYIRRAGHSPASGPAVTPQLPVGPVGDGLGSCCCLNFNWGWFGGVAVASAGYRRAGPAGQAARGAVAARAFSWGPFGISCTSCPEGDGECACSCQENGQPCAQRGNVTVCEP
jgi:hypothetical protein